MVNRYFEVDAAELFALADGFAQGQRLVQQELMTSGQQMGQELVTQARAGAPVASGQLVGSIGPAIVAVVGSDVQITVAAKDRKARWHEEGTGIYGPKGTPIRPKSGKFLVWDGPNGRVFAREVRGVPAKWYMRDGLARSKARINQLMAEAARRVVARLIAGGR